MTPVLPKKEKRPVYYSIVLLLALFFAGIFLYSLTSPDGFISSKFMKSVSKPKATATSCNDDRQVWTNFRKDWLDSGLDKRCKAAIGKDRPCDSINKFENMTKCPADFNSPYLFSTEQQDYYLYSRHFKNMKRQGIYVDLATNRPILYSNTYFFDRCLGWKGLCIEANPIYYQRIYSRRSCSLVPTCISTVEGEIVKFNIPPGADGGGGGGIYAEDYKLYDQNASQDEKNRMLELKCTTFDTVVNRFNISVIDYLSLDIEGLEPKILQNISWDKIRINFITVEDNTITQPFLDFMTTKGYTRHVITHTDEEELMSSETGRMLRHDSLFVHDSVEFGKPV